MADHPIPHEASRSKARAIYRAAFRQPATDHQRGRRMMHGAACRRVIGMVDGRRTRSFWTAEQVERLCTIGCPPAPRPTTHKGRWTNTTIGVSARVRRRRPPAIRSARFRASDLGRRCCQRRRSGGPADRTCSGVRRRTPDRLPHDPSRHRDRRDKPDVLDLSVAIMSRIAAIRLRRSLGSSVV